MNEPVSVSLRRVLYVHSVSEVLLIHTSVDPNVELSLLNLPIPRDLDPSTSTWGHEWWGPLVSLSFGRKESTKFPSVDLGVDSDTLTSTTDGLRDYTLSLSK